MLFVCLFVVLLLMSVCLFATGTLREGEDTDNDSVRLSRAFDVLQDDLKRSSFPKVLASLLDSFIQEL